jgi:hypothetical protein
MTRPGAAGWQPDDAKELEAALSLSEFARHDYPGHVAVFTRRSVRTTVPSPLVLKVIPEPPHRRAFTLSDVSDGVGFFKFGYSGIHLCPNPFGSPKAKFHTQLELEGQSHFSVRLVAGDGSLGHGGVAAMGSSMQTSATFHIGLCSAENGAVAFGESHILHTNETYDWEVGFAPAYGPHTLALATEMTNGLDAPLPCYFIDPTFK